MGLIITYHNLNQGRLRETGPTKQTHNDYPIFKYPKCI